MDGIEVSVSKSRQNSDVNIVKVAGYVDTTTSVELETALDGLLKNKEYKIVVDLEAVDYISSAGWGIFISEIKGIRENGGDLKLVNMMSDVFEVFELLEFKHILKAYNSVAEAVSVFDSSSLGSERVTHAASRVGSNVRTGQGLRSDAGRSIHDTGDAYSTGPKTVSNGDESLKNLSIEDKLKRIVVANPELGAWKIKKDLNTPKYYNTRVGFFEVRRIMHRLSLDSFGKRYRFSQSY